MVREGIEHEFKQAFKNWHETIKVRPNNGLYLGEYRDFREHQYMENGKSKTSMAPVPHEEQSLEWRAWKVYCYWRDKLLAST